MGLLKAFHVLFFPLSLVLFVIGLLAQDLLVLYSGMALLFAVNIAYAICDLSKRSVFLFFHLGLALFLISRPTIKLLEGGVLTELSIDFGGAQFSLAIIFLSMFFLRLGSGAAEWRQHNKDEKVAAHPSWQLKDVRDNPILPTLRIASAIVYVIGFIGLMWLGMLKLQAMQGLSYEDYYTVSISQYTNLLVRTIATMEPYALCAFLATLPKKRPATVMLIMHIITTIPVLIIGSRADFVLGFLFLVLYYVLRNYIDGKGSWIGHFERVLVAIFLPVGIIAMGLVSVIRANAQIVNFSLFDSLVTAIYQQGVTYEVLSKGYAAREMIAAMGFKGFSFGALTDYILQGPFGIYILGNTNLGSSNSIDLAVQGHSYAHTMSYYMHWRYLQGAGWGSSYLLELYQDFGSLGVSIFSFVFGMILSYLPRLLKRSWLTGTLTLTICIVIFHMPRGAAIEWISYIWTLQFWFTLILIGGLVYVMRSKRFAGLVKVCRTWLGHASFANLRSIRVPESWNRLLQLNGQIQLNGQLQPNRQLQLNGQLQPLRKVMDRHHEYDYVGRSVGDGQAPHRLHPAHHGTLRWIGGGSELTQVREGAYNHLYG